VTSYLVTGGSGYFGSLLVQRLVRSGHDVRVLDLNDAADRPADVEFVRGDVRDRAIVREAVEGIDVVMNNVAQVPLARDLDLLRTVNVDRMPLEMRRMHTPSKAWRRVFSPSRIFAQTLTESPGRNSGSAAVRR
jgi:NAD(P)-dependent dehydrogenase (short-subunit alcohol dehydrogenase family)